MSENVINRLNNNVAELQKDMASVSVLADRFDIAIEKLTEVSSTVPQLLAVQGNRLEVQEKVQEKLQVMVEQRRTELEQAVKDINQKIAGIESDLQSDMDSNHSKVIDKIEELRKESSQQHSGVNKRIGGLEKWMWTMIGCGTVLSIIIANADIFVSLLGG